MAVLLQAKFLVMTNYLAFCCRWPDQIFSVYPKKSFWPLLSVFYLGTFFIAIYSVQVLLLLLWQNKGICPITERGREGMLTIKLTFHPSLQ
jgi:hypothetical protein